MIASRNSPKPAASRLRRLIFGLLPVSVLGGLLFVMNRHRPVSPAPLAEVHRQNLELQAGKWYAPGQTNGFTGLLLDTYDDGTMKSRSSVANGLLEGLSIGWHTNGQPQVEEHFVAGISHGMRTKWYPNGRKLSEVNVVQGKLDGVFRRWHENGSLAEEVALKQGDPDGMSRAYYPSGFIKAQARLQRGKVREREYWKDGEYSQASLKSDTPVDGKVN